METNDGIVRTCSDDLLKETQYGVNPSKAFTIPFHTKVVVSRRVEDSVRTLGNPYWPLLKRPWP
uniref:Uncharacterized protein n=1 Tax=Pristionchus pacificus TaxID=54126 RepID=A0A2A6D362_PRIPA|eukprot:PDM84757.1 hypothetical protein PRIPAC_33780 [Pristionchus pacificus]